MCTCQPDCPGEHCCSYLTRLCGYSTWPPVGNLYRNPIPGSSHLHSHHHSCLVNKNWCTMAHEPDLNIWIIHQTKKNISTAHICMNIQQANVLTNWQLGWKIDTVGGIIFPTKFVCVERREQQEKWPVPAPTFMPSESLSRPAKGFGQQNAHCKQSWHYCNDLTVSFL